MSLEATENDDLRIVVAESTIRKELALQVVILCVAVDNPHHNPEPQKMRHCVQLSWIGYPTKEMREEDADPGGNATKQHISLEDRPLKTLHSEVQKGEG